ncbi:hypothetical protein CkaCkLH20_11908 [Colletotrichum karsti]|uniref:Apple domain-containing protein n=1 Tax=Colletotrichum karsti TaxID=1095194 RepID=A0A9P6LFQ3_9PEZI|nr:uncharacterized protein CkaCkLH20_11908 [Colletotrichum karsti]KAF9870602.1 hypothetical protein CkaCkLH20_11908 [Colletotrichum karsti]
MRSTTLIAAFAALVKAQSGLDFDMIDAAPDPPIATVPIGAAAATVVSYDANAAAASVSSDVKASPLPQETAPAMATSAAKMKKSLVQRSPCSPQPAGNGPVPNPDTSAAFLSSTDLSNAANNAPTPDGYVNTFKNLQASSSAYGYMGYTTLNAYDTKVCASKCDAINGCIAFNIYFERDPSIEPADSCPNPSSTNVIKCVFWGGLVDQNNANNRGQWRNNFEVVIAGSNGYVVRRAADQPGYNSAINLGDAAINAPSDCAGFDTFMGSKIFTNGPFDPKLCAAACTAQSEYNLAHPPQNAPAQTCQFFNTFFVLKNGIPEGQYCSLYSKAWDVSYATNTGQWRGNDRYTIFHSFSYTNSTNPGKPRIPCPVASASSTIVQSTLQPYCSTLLGYTTPTTTATQTAFATVPSTTVTSTVTPLASTTTTTTQLVAVTKQLKRALAPRPTTTCLHDDETPEDHSYQISQGLRARDDSPLVNGTTENGHFVDMDVPVDMTNTTSPSKRRIRRDGTPAGLAAFPADVISSACSLVATPVTTTVTASATTTQTVVSGAALATTTAPTSTIVVVQTVTSTTTINVAPNAPTGAIGYLTVNPVVNSPARYVLSDDSTHMTDNWYRQGQRETFIVAADGTLYSVTNNSYYYIQNYEMSLVYWSNSKSAAQSGFTATPLGDGTSKVTLSSGGKNWKFCLRTVSTGDGNSGAGMHMRAYSGTNTYGTGCVDVDLIIVPV